MISIKAFHSGAFDGRRLMNGELESKILELVNSKKMGIDSVNRVYKQHTREMLISRFINYVRGIISLFAIR